MNSQEKNRTIVAEEILEVRYVPRGGFLSKAGEIADFICDKGIFPHWEIDSSTVKFRDSPKAPKNLHAFISYKNAGIVAIDSPTANYFKDKAQNYWSTISSNSYFSIPQIQRIGVRNRFYIDVGHSFEEVEGSMFNYLCKSEVMRAIGGARKDLQVVIDAETKAGKLRTIFGPLMKGQSNEMFSFQSDAFKNAGVFIDFDLSVDRPGAEKKVVENFIKIACDENWARLERLLEQMGF